MILLDSGPFLSDYLCLNPFAVLFVGLYVLMSRENSWDEANVLNVLRRLAVTCQTRAYRYFAAHQPAFCRALLQVTLSASLFSFLHTALRSVLCCAVLE